MSSAHLWVYGTLRRGCSNRYARLLAHSARYIGSAKVQARLYRVKWYPGLRLTHHSESWVMGDLFRLHDLRTLKTLDAYEGSNEYRRVQTTAIPENGVRVTCWVYEYIGRLSEDRRILSGDWFAENKI